MLAEKLESLSVGVALYISGTNGLLLTMLLVAVLATPQVAFNMYAQHKYQSFSAREDSFAGLTLGAQQVTSVTAGGAVTDEVSYYGYSRDSAMLAASLLDVVYVTIFLACVLIMRYGQQRRVAATKAGKVTLGRYSLLVRAGLPMEETATPDMAEEVKAHFEALVGPGTVREVSITTQAATVLELLQRRTTLLAKRRKFASVVNRSRGVWGGLSYDHYASRVRDVDDEIAAALLHPKTGPAVAFVTFETTEARDRVLLEYQNPLNNYYVQPAFLRLRGELSMYVAAAPEPEDLYWGHLPYNVFFQQMRGLSTSCLSLVWVVFTAIIITVADTQGQQRPPQIDQAVTEEAGTLFCEASFGLDASVTNATQDALGRAFVTEFINQDFSAVDCISFVGNGIFLGADSGVYPVAQGTVVNLDSIGPISTNVSVVEANLGNLGYQCAAFACYGAYCELKGLSAWYFNEDNGLYGYCYYYWSTWARGTGTLIAATFVSKGVEETIEYVAAHLAMFEKHWTKTRTNISACNKCFMASLFNMLLILIIVFGHIQGFPSSGLGNIPFIFGGKYTDFSREWYGEVGSAFMRTMAAQAFVPHMLYMGKIALRWTYNAATRNQCPNQEALKSNLGPAEFNMPTRYGQMHATLYVTFALSSGIPVLTHFACFYMLLSFITDRVALLRCAAKPPVSDESLSFNSLDSLPVAVVLHFAGGVWMFGAVGTRYVSGGYMDTSGVSPLQTELSQDATFADQFNVRKRLLKLTAMPQFVGFVVSLVLLFVYYYGSHAVRLAKALRIRHSGEPAADEDKSEKLPPLAVLLPPTELGEGAAHKAYATLFGVAQVPLLAALGADGTSITWDGPVCYDVTVDSRHISDLAELGATGDGLTLTEAATFTVFSHGGRGRCPSVKAALVLTRRQLSILHSSGGLASATAAVADHEAAWAAAGLPPTPGYEPASPAQRRPSAASQRRPSLANDPSGRIGSWLAASPGQGPPEDKDDVEDVELRNLEDTAGPSSPQRQGRRPSATSAVVAARLTGQGPAHRPVQPPAGKKSKAP